MLQEVCESIDNYFVPLYAERRTYTISDGNASVGGSDGSLAVSSYTSGSISIPTMLGGCPVTIIGQNAFYTCSWLTAVTIPDGVKKIGKNAFYGCKNLTSVTIPDSVKTKLDEYLLRKRKKES
jgi:hypothetical protein